ncbi:hypothetical protein NLG07_07500 [Alteromonas sp. LMIT006]|uniref:hypothetical protein n=1 Tax=Alteromonadaceae TaxID=72275 RepID=UPI0020CA8BEA|nr:hypothetical protein [Alteromonas sp. LMIT006]UTP71859.1 hypothetical protein NLG07_07500 [Alteromonas sp. LMIT006]
MKQLLSKLFSPAPRTKDTSDILAKAYEESHYKSLWQDTGEVMYLFDTIKLSFESQRGPVTYEKLSIEDVQDILQDIASSNSPSMTLKTTAEQTAEIRITLCGITWQTFNGKLRAMAIPDAAVLRSTSPCFSKSQAVFKHADLMANIDSDLLFLPNQTNVFNYFDVSVADYFAQLKAINQRFSQNKDHLICLNKENYDAPFTEHETERLALLNISNELPDRS